FSLAICDEREYQLHLLRSLLFKRCDEVKGGWTRPSRAAGGGGGAVWCLGGRPQPCERAGRGVGRLLPSLWSVARRIFGSPTQPGARFNPLFLCGGCGLGKTHLLSAVAAGLAHARPLGTVVCLTAENFVNEMIAALEARRMERFRRKFRGVQTLVVDDIQFLAE